MDNDKLSIEAARRAVVDSENSNGKDSLETSYKLDALAALLKEQGHLLEAANESARAKAIRASVFARESRAQEEKTGAIHADRDMTAVGFLKMAYRAAVMFSLAGLICAIVLPTKTIEAFLGREVLGSLSSATLIQLVLFPLKTMPRWLKYVINAFVSGIIWTILERL